LAPSPRPAPKARKPRNPLPPSPPPQAGLSAKHQEILEEGLALIAERGVAGASLRELARRVGVSQPSLYHYFPTKEDLLSQIVNYCGNAMLSPPVNQALPRSLAEMPRYIAEGVLSLYVTERHPMFVRFMFAVTTAEPRYRPIFHGILVERAAAVMRFLLAPHVARGEVEAEMGEHVLRMEINAIGLALIEDRVLFHASKPSKEVLRFIEAVVHLTEKLLGVEPGAAR
jgi:AcrR family transcriptional regulator